MIQQSTPILQIIAHSSFNDYISIRSIKDSIQEPVKPPQILNDYLVTRHSF